MSVYVSYIYAIRRRWSCSLTHVWRFQEKHHKTKTSQKLQTSNDMDSLCKLIDSRSFTFLCADRGIRIWHSSLVVRWVAWPKKLHMVALPRFGLHWPYDSPFLLQLHSFTIDWSCLSVTGHLPSQVEKGLKNSSPAKVPLLGGSAGLLADGTRPTQCRDCCFSSNSSKTISMSRQVTWVDTPFTSASTTGQLSTKIKSRSPVIKWDQVFMATRTA